MYEELLKELPQHCDNAKQKENIEIINIIITDSKYKSIFEDILPKEMDKLINYINRANMKKLLHHYKLNIDLIIKCRYLYMGITDDADIDILKKYDNVDQDTIIRFMFNGAHNYSIRALMSNKLLCYIIDNCSYSLDEWKAYQKDLLAYYSADNAKFIYDYIDNLCYYNRSLRSIWINTIVIL